MRSGMKNMDLKILIGNYCKDAAWAECLKHYYKKKS